MIEPTDPHEKRELETIAPEGVLDTIRQKLMNLATWPFKEIAVNYLKKDVSAWLKEGTLCLLDQAETHVITLIEKAGLKYAEFRKTVEEDWDNYVEFLLYRLGFTSVPQGDGDELVAFTGFPLETEEQEPQNIFATVLSQIVISVLAEMISNFFSKKS